MKVRLATLGVVLAAWWVLSLGSSQFGLPGPEQVVRAFGRLAEGGRLAHALQVTLTSFAAGGVLSILIGVIATAIIARLEVAITPWRQQA